MGDTTMAVEPIYVTSHAVLRTPALNAATARGGTVGIPDPARLRLQHQDLCHALQRCGLHVTVLHRDETDGASPGGLAVVTPHLAVIATAGSAGARRDTAALLAGTRFIKFILPPGQLDARDVVHLGGHFYIRLSTHTNQEGAAQLAFFLREYGQGVTMLASSGADSEAPLKSLVAGVAPGAVLIAESLAGDDAFTVCDKIVIPAREQGVGVLPVNGTLLAPAGRGETAARLRSHGYAVTEVNISELEKIGLDLPSLCLLLDQAEARDRGNILPFAPRNLAAA